LTATPNQEYFPKPSHPGKRGASDIPTRDASRLVASSCVKQIIVNKLVLLAGNPEGLHQMQVGLRRLRAAISLFSDILEERETDAIKSQLKWLTEELGPAREFQVFLTGVVEPARRHHGRLNAEMRPSQFLPPRN
jgi:triphosphatase